MDTSHCLEYLIAQASRLKYATYTIGFMKVRMEGRCEKNITTYLHPPPPPPPHTHHVWVQTNCHEWVKTRKGGLMNNMDAEASAAFSKWHVTTKQCLCQGRWYTGLKETRSKPTWRNMVSSKAAVTRPDNRERGSWTGRATVYTGPHHLRSRSSIEFTDVTWIITSTVAIA